MPLAEFCRFAGPAPQWAQKREGNKAATPFALRLKGMLCGFDLDQLARRRWIGNRFATFLEVFQMKFNRLSNEARTSSSNLPSTE